MRTFVVVAVIAGLCCRIAIAQTGSGPHFESASVKPAAPDSDTFVKARGEGLEISRATLNAVIALAYRVQPFQVSGGPAWIRSEHFSITARAAESPSGDQLFSMIQSLLEERFSLKVHFETKLRPIYVLVEGKAGKTRPGGLGVSEEGSCKKADLTAPPDPQACGSVGMGANHVEGVEISMSRLAEALTRVLDRKVIDRTGRTEKFNVSLRWVPDGNTDDTIVVPPDTPAIFVAIREQLGLRLEAGKAPVEVLVVDGALRPSTN